MYVRICMLKSRIEDPGPTLEKNLDPDPTFKNNWIRQ